MVKTSVALYKIVCYNPYGNTVIQTGGLPMIKVSEEIGKFLGNREFTGIRMIKSGKVVRTPPRLHPAGHHSVRQDRRRLDPRAEDPRGARPGLRHRRRLRRRPRALRGRQEGRAAGGHRVVCRFRPSPAFLPTASEYLKKAGQASDHAPLMNGAQEREEDMIILTRM